MSPGAEDNSKPRADQRTPGPASGMTLDRDAATRARDRNSALMARGPQQQRGQPSEAGQHHEHHHHHVLIDANEDRWRWRRKIRDNPHQLRLYRLLVAIAGLLLVCLGFISGPIPGPGGIPLVLLGLAIWSSEFEWAHQLMQWFKQVLHRFRAWPRRAQVMFWVAFGATCATLGYSYMLLT